MHIFKFLQLIAHVDENLYKELYGISKLKLSQKNCQKWNEYKISIDQKILNNIKNYNPVEE